MPSATLPALTVRQPWATLIALGVKRYETRSWNTAHRGPLAIHAGMRVPNTALLASEPFAAALRGVLARGALPRGAIIAFVRVVNTMPITPELAAGLTAEEPAFGDYRPGRWAWELADVRMLDVPVPASGALGLWRWEPPRGDG